MSSQKVVLTKDVARLGTINEHSYLEGNPTLDTVARQMKNAASKSRDGPRSRKRMDSASSMYADPMSRLFPRTRPNLMDYFRGNEQQMSVDEDSDLSYVHCLQSSFPMCLLMLFLSYSWFL